MIGNFLLQETANLKPSDGIIHKLLTFIYSLAHQIGVGLMKLANLILPNIEIPENIIDPVGFLAFLTLFLILVQAAKKIAWIIVGIGWILILIRIFMIIFKVG